MSTDRNEKISNHEKGMFRDNLPSVGMDQTNLVSEVESMMVSAGLWLWWACQEWRDVPDPEAPASLGGKEEVLFITFCCVSLLGGCWTCREGPASLPEENICLGKYLLVKEDFKKSCLGPQNLLHTWLPVCKWRIDFRHFRISELRASYHLCWSSPCCHRLTMPVCLDTLFHSRHGH